MKKREKKKEKVNKKRVESGNVSDNESQLFSNSK
jgi:hypothetical protein